MSLNSIKLVLVNQTVTNETGKYFHARFVEILTISRAFRRVKFLVSRVYEYTIRLPFNIIGDKNAYNRGFFQHIIGCFSLPALHKSQHAYFF